MKTVRSAPGADISIGSQADVSDWPTTSFPSWNGRAARALADIRQLTREREWPSKTVLRKSSELREFLEVVGDKPVNAYRQVDGVNFKDVQLALPVYRQRPPFKGFKLTEAAKKTSEMRTGDATVDLLDPITINDKIGTVSLFFEWAKSRDGRVINPLAGLRIPRAKNKRRGKKRQPWTVDELNRMFDAPIYTGCRSECHWQQPGDVVLRQSAKYWVPLIALFSGMRLGVPTARLSPAHPTRLTKSVMHSASNPRALILQFPCTQFRNS